ncbi:helix-turn-helix transcriptional regulator [Niallia sp. FSL M8-0099]|uniref:helix-turn-helix transcriptional regulator n=1 Tax=Niallia sp. FSL M8-0099 TaxID=2954519 RepID=UPI0030F578DB
MLGDFVVIKSKLRVKIAETGIKQNKLSEELNVTPQTFSSWVNGKAVPSLEVAFKLAKKLDCTIEEIFEYIED